jgi:hypothetical protein
METQYVNVKITCILFYFSVEITTAASSSTRTPQSSFLPSTTTEAAPRSVELRVGLEIVAVEASRATLRWRKILDNETQYIDGLQIRYRVAGEKVQVYERTRVDGLFLQ